MKTTTRILLLATVLLSLLSTSCNRRSKIIDTQRINIQSAEAEFYGDPSRIGIDFYNLFLYDAKLTSNPKGDGRFIYLELNSDLTNINEILAGTYVDNNSSQLNKFTFQQGSWQTDSDGDYVVGSYIGEYVGNQFLIYPISRGNIRVSKNGNTYSISGIVKAEGKEFDVEYRGMVDMYDMVVPLPETLTHGEIWYHGNMAGNGNTVKLYTVRLGADDVKISNFAGSGDAMQIDLYAPWNTSPLTIIPDGVYPIKIDNVDAFTAGDGYYDSYDEADYGTWYYTADALSVNNGYVKTTYLDGSYYRLDFSFTDDYYGYQFTGRYEGELAFINKTSSPIAVRQQVVREAGSKLNKRVAVEERSVRGRAAADRSLMNTRKELRDKSSVGRSIRQER